MELCKEYKNKAMCISKLKENDLLYTDCIYYGKDGITNEKKMIKVISFNKCTIDCDNCRVKRNIETEIIDENKFCYFCLNSNLTTTSGHKIVDIKEEEVQCLRAQ